MTCNRMVRLALACGPLALLSAGCGIGPATLPDADGDGLADFWEEDNGLNPGAADSDGDGYSDYDEIFGHADPMDDEDHPYIGGWERSAVPPELLEAETGSEVGDTAENFALYDQFGEKVNLYSFYGQLIQIENAAEW